MTERYNTEEPNFISLLQLLSQQRGLIIAVMLFVTLLSALYILIQKPIYEARVIIGAPPEIKTTVLNMNLFSYLSPPKGASFTSSELYSLFTPILKSEAVRQVFLTQHKNLLKTIHIQEDKRTVPFKILIKVKAKSPADAKKYLKKYLSFVNEKSLKRLTPLLQKKEGILLNNIKKQVDLLQKITKSNKDFFSSPIGNEGGANLAAKVKNAVLSSSANELIKLYADHYKSSTTLLKNEPIELFSFFSKIDVNDDHVTSKLEYILICGVLGGLIIGFFVAVIKVDRSLRNPVTEL
ncbi:Wzz/FepE/Etk N-terminal domain-containing protein [Legionella sp. km772]|uniref:Wzz/FepE/Etk N-terminal domain-containing protein n=1 Tax=Legionella sp. km772 TaxID=2498111 RepID=UPI000F8D91CD|nr:Wzz/FepE/Etk N-terminal domain-containing protein [Legionella sp. km772]RUR12123.1 hypothetical protein ELY15_06135 [Legionella sp. km772]